jgi:fatty acid desaturase
MDTAGDTTSQKLLDRSALAQTIRELSVLQPWRSIWAIASQWLVIAAAVAASLIWRHWPVYVVAGIVIATRQHALGVLVHEAAHYRLFRRRDFGDVISDFFLAFPSGISTSVYRGHHFEHHKFVNTNNDPNIQLVAGDEDWLWPKLPWECAKIFAHDLIGINCHYMANTLWSWSPWNLTKWERLRVILFVAALVTTLTLIGGWKLFFILWILPGATTLTLINRMRNLAEHYGVENENELNASRHVQPIWWERLIFAPCNICYHLEHHLFPSVPFYNLPQLHARLMQQDVFRAQAHLTQSYTGIAKGVIAELIRRSPSASSVSP